MTPEYAPMIDLRSALVQRLADGLAVVVADLEAPLDAPRAMRQPRADADRALYLDLGVQPDGWLWIVGASS